MEENQVVVVGDGWAALGAVGFLGGSGVPVRWIAGGFPRFLAPLPSFSSGPGLEAWKDLVSHLGLEVGQAEEGSFLREFKNKAFREASWTKLSESEARITRMNESLWCPETRFVPSFESRFEKDPVELEEGIRQSIAKFAHVQRREGVSVKDFLIEKGHAKGVILDSGETVSGSHVFYADRAVSIGGHAGFRHREPFGALQILFVHEQAIGGLGQNLGGILTQEGLQEAFFAPVTKESGDEFQRHVFGYFSADGKRSIWTLFLTAEETEDNHEITKKLRRIKQVLDRMFTGPSWLPEGKESFQATILDEQVRLIEKAVFVKGESPEEPVTLSKIHGLFFLTDAYGPSSAMHQASMTVGRISSMSFPSSCPSP